VLTDPLVRVDACVRVPGAAFDEQRMAYLSRTPAAQAPLALYGGGSFRQLPIAGSGAAGSYGQAASSSEWPSPADSFSAFCRSPPGSFRR
jgi:hypothetical protein